MNSEIKARLREWFRACEDRLRAAEEFSDALLKGPSTTIGQASRRCGELCQKEQHGREPMDYSFQKAIAQHRRH